MKLTPSSTIVIFGTALGVIVFTIWWFSPPPVPPPPLPPPPATRPARPPINPALTPALIQAVSFGQIPEARKLLDAGGDPNAKDEKGRSLLKTAASMGWTEIVVMLLDAGAEINAKESDSSTALCWAAWVKRTEIVGILIKRGADVNILQPNGMTPVNYAATAGDQKAVEMMVAAGAKLNFKGLQPVTVSAGESGNVELMQFFVDRGGDLNVGNYAQQTPLDMAAGCNRFEMIAWLIEHGANVEAYDLPGMTPLICAAMNPNPGAGQSIKILLAHGAKVNAMSRVRMSGRTPDGQAFEMGPYAAIHMAAMHGLPESVTALLDGGADPNLKEDKGKTALDIAKKFNRQDVVAILEQHGAK